MRRGLTLIELIFSMVIIALAFTVFPKILQISAKTSLQGVKEEALFSGMTLMGLIKNLPWDEKNSVYDDYLIVTNGNNIYECSNGIYRIGGFYGSRNCRHRLDASTIGADSDDTYPDDIDDFNGKDINATNYNDTREYNISVTVEYRNDKIDGDFNRSFSSSSGGTTNTKYIAIAIMPQKRQKAFSASTIANIYYISANIGQIRVRRLPWRH